MSAHHSFIIGWLTSGLHLALWLVLEIVVETASHALASTSLVVSSSLIVVIIASLSLILSAASASSSYSSVVLATSTTLTTAFSPLIAVVPLHGL